MYDYRKVKTIYKAYLKLMIDSKSCSRLIIEQDPIWNRTRIYMTNYPLAKEWGITLPYNKGKAVDFELFEQALSQPKVRLDMLYRASLWS